MINFNEDNLVQQTVADYFADELKWDVVYAYNQEVFSEAEAGGSRVYLGRKSERDVVLTDPLLDALKRYNPGLPDEAYQSAARQIVEASSALSMLQTNREKYDLLRDGVKVSYRTSEGIEKKTLRVFDFDNPENNKFLAVREMWVKGVLYRRRADIVGFVNGVPLLFMELKNVNRDIRHAYEENFTDYKDTVPHLFHHNALVVLGNGRDARLGSLSAPFKFFREWKRLDEDEKGTVNMETLLKGVCSKQNFIEIFENFILFDDSGESLVKIVAQNQQFLGVNKAMKAVEERDERQGKLGVFWHTQGSGKSYSMVFFSRKIHRRIGANFTFLVLTDREDLDGQIYKTFAGCGAVKKDDKLRAGSGKHLKTLLGQQKAYVFSLIQKFNEDVDPNEPYSDRRDIIVMIDEAHRTQYGRLSLNRTNALPNANYIAFTGTPLMKDDNITERFFGGYVSRYGFERAVEDGATLPLYYDARGEKLGLATTELNEKIAAKLDELELDTLDVDTEQRLERELARDYHIITAPERLDKVARDFVKHYSTAWETGKAMFVCIDKITTVKMHSLITKYWDERIAEFEKDLVNASDEQNEKYRRDQIAWMKETKIAVMISEEQNEVKKFRQWDLDITPHRALIKNGFDAEDGQRLDMETAFKRDGHPFRVAIVCAMWLTGFDVKSLSTLYLDKPLKAHTLMQTIARANRVYEGKNNGLIVDYCGILKNLRKALADYAGTGSDTGDVDPAKPEEELLADLDEAIQFIVEFLAEENVRLEDIIEAKGFARIAEIDKAKEVINENDETRKRFEIMARTVFRTFKACLNIDGVNDYRLRYDAINIIYKNLQEDREQADISHIIKELHGVIGAEIGHRVAGEEVDERLYDISAIDFERLKQEFAKSPKKQTITQELKDVIEDRLRKMLAQNPLRIDLQKRFEEMISDYNLEKDRKTIERSFEDLWKFYRELDEEASRAIREELDEETLALFDLLMKENLVKKDIDYLKTVARQLLATLQAESKRIADWQAKEATRDSMKQTIFDFLYSDQTGLPESYTDQEIEVKSELIFSHVFYTLDRGRELV